MPPDRAVIWTQAGGNPTKIGALEFVAGFMPQLLALVPPRHAGNIQRRLQQLHFDRHGPELRGRPLHEQDWLSLLCFGRNGVGAIDVFPSDALAQDYYATPIRQHSWSDLPRLIRFYQGRSTSTEIDQLLMEPVAGIPGMHPKVLLDEWLVKFNAPNFPGLLAIESLAYEIHRSAGCDVPETKLSEIEGIPILASRRFDRLNGTPLPMESLFSILAERAPMTFRSNTDGSLEDVLALMLELNAKAPSGMEAYRRIVLSLLTGNGDLHTENMSIIGQGADKRLSPVYDPAPMRAYRGRPNYDLLSALPFSGIGGVLPVTGYREFADSGQTPSDLRARVTKLGTFAGLSLDEAEDELDRLLCTCQNFTDAAEEILRSALPADYSGRTPDIP